MAARFSDFTRRFLPVCFVVSVLLLPISSSAAQHWGIDNVNVSFGPGHYGFASDGACYGMVYTAKMYQKLGLEKIRPFAKVTDPESSGKGAKAASKELFLEQFAALAQNYVFRDRDMDKFYAQPTNPFVVDKSLSGVSPKDPQILVLSNEAAVASGKDEEMYAHAVLVQSRKETAISIQYQVYDPNTSGQEIVLFIDKKTGKFSGLQDYDTIRHDTTSPDSQNVKWLEALVRGAAHEDKDQYLPVWRGTKDLPSSDAEYMKQRRSRSSLHIVEPPAPSQAVSNGVSALKTDEVGGVRLYFDPVITTERYRPEARWVLVGELVDKLVEGKSNFLLQPTYEEDLQAVNLKSILNASGDNPDLGGLTRVLGFTRNRKTGEVYLLGKSEPNTPAIPLDVLSVALQLIWKNKSTPAISLDPDPDDFCGLQHVRLEQFPQAYRDTQFTQIMLDADYEMKRMMLGEDKPDVDGYTCFMDLLKEQPTALSAEYFRWWLTPKDTSGAAVYHYARGDVEVYYYDSNVCLLTETMKRAGSALTGTGGQDPLTEQAAELFTRYYDKIEQQRPIFHELHGLFDVSKLAAVLRVTNASDEILLEIAGRDVKHVDIRQTYDGLGPIPVPIKGASASSYLFIGGGCVSRSPLRSGDLVSIDSALAEPLLDAMGQASDGRFSFTMSAPPEVPLDPKNALLLDGDAESASALQEVMAGDLQAAIKRLNRVLKDDPSHVKATTVRAIAGMAAGSYASALKDINAAMKTEPWLRALRGRIRVASGDLSGGLEDARWAAQAFPDRTEVQVQKLWVDIETLQLRDAKKDFQRVRSMLPLDPEIDKLGRLLRLVSGMEPNQARKFLKAQLAMPLSIGRPLTQALALLQAGRIPAALDLIRQVQEKAGSTGPAASAVYAQERCRLLLALVHYAAGDRDSINTARGYMTKLEKKRPNWPSVLYYRVMVDQSMPFSQAASMYLKAAKMSGENDPLLLEARVRDGLDLKSQVGWQLALAGVEHVGKYKGFTAKTISAIIDQVSTACPNGPAAYSLSLLKKHVGTREQEIKGKVKLSKIQMQRLNREFQQATLKVPPVRMKSIGTDFLALKQTVETILENRCRFANDEKSYTEAGILFSAVMKGLNTDWTNPKTAEQAAEESFTAYGMFADLLVNRIKENGLYKEFMSSYNEGSMDLTTLLDGLDRIAEPMEQAIPGLSPCSIYVLRSAVCARYQALVPNLDLKEISSEIATRHSRTADLIQDNAGSLVEIKTAAIWFQAQAMLASQQETDIEAAAKTMADYHRRGESLNRRFAIEMALR